MLNEIIFDIETQNTYQEVGSRDTRLLKISLVGVYTTEDGLYTSYLESDLPKLWPILEKADRLIGYNINNFDIPVLGNYYPGDLMKRPTLDILAVIEKVLGFRIKLDDVANATLGMGKSGNGLQAVEYWRNGEIEKLREYCIQDVRVTKELYDFGVRRGSLVYIDKLGRKKDIPVDFAIKEKCAPINLTIGL